MKHHITLATALATLAVPAMAEGPLTYFTWSGYELPEFHQSYLTQHPEGPEISLFGDDDDAFTKVKAGFRPDIAHPCYDKIARWNAAGLLEPIDTTKIKNWENIFPVFRNLPDKGVVRGETSDFWGQQTSRGRTPLVVEC